MTCRWSSRSRGLTVGASDRDEINKILDALQFRGELRDRLFKTLGHGARSRPRRASRSRSSPSDPTRWPRWLAALPEGRAGLAFKGTYGSGTGRIDSIAIAAADEGAEGAPGGRRAAFIDPTTLTEADEGALRAWLGDASKAKAVHDAKGPMLALWAHGMELRGLTCDTALAAYLAMPGQRVVRRWRTSCAALPAAASCAARPRPAARPASSTTTRTTTRPATSRCARMAVRELADALEAFLEPRGGTHLMSDVELPLVTVLAEMERAGIAADRDYFSGLESEFGAAVKQAVEAAHAAVGEQFNLGSPKQLQEILFVKLGLPKTKKIKTGYSTDADPARLAGHADRPRAPDDHAAPP